MKRFSTYEAVTVESVVKSSSILFEALEGRQYYSASKLIPITPQLVASVQPALDLQTSTATTTNGTATKVITAPRPPASKSKKKFGRYDLTFDPQNGHAGPTYPGFQQGFWTSAGGMADPTGSYADKKETTAVANLAKNGGTNWWNGSTVQPGDLTFLDFEIDNNEPVSFYTQRITWFHQADPRGKVGIYGLTPGFEGLDRDLVINPTPQVKAQIHAQMRADASLINAMDVLIVPSYMLGPACDQRDLQWISAVANDYHQAFPAKTVLAWTWGAYHTAWNPPNDVLSDAMTQSYVDTCRSACDGMVVWGPCADDGKLLQCAADAVHPNLQDTTLPPLLNPSSSSNAGLFSTQTINSLADSLLD